DINLARDREEGNTCEQVISYVPGIGWISLIFGAEKIGAVLAAGENVAYASGGLPWGVSLTILNQLVIAPQVNECTDDKEGYFATLFVPKENTKSSQTADIEKNVSGNALDGIREFADRIDANNNGGSLTDKVLQESTGKVKELVDAAQKNDVAEIELRVTGSSSGYLSASEVMYFWTGGDALIEPAKYNDTGRTLILTEDGHTITLDNAQGTVSVDGIEVIGEDHADHERLSNKNLEIPAIELPQRLQGYSLGTDANQLLLTINVRGEALVQDVELLDCIQEAVLLQSGVPLNSNNMSEAFGTTEQVTTTVYPSISFDAIRNRILLGGQLPQNANGGSASVNVFADRHVTVTGAPNSSAGSFLSALYENGSVIYKPQTNELLIWLRHHEQAIVTDADVQSFTGNLTTTENPLTACEEPAINLNVETDSATAATKLKGDNLTAGLEKNGPFQVFETETKRFILYSQLVGGECKDFFKVINKETGDVYEQEITGINQNEDGTININTADGRSHDILFSDENGKPTITYDGQSEVLRSASGAGGSFYYDPNKGAYYAENAQFIPLNENFKNQGLAFQANPDGSVSGKAGDNVFVINPAQGGEGLFNIPSLPEDAAGWMILVLVMMGIVAGIYVDSRRKNNLLN
ncbi:MAG: hypothetical protein AABY11_01315, partial [archaeon]